ncbi:MAG: response regulator [Xenococcus sp. MO_188.B8]|nr:response regulator [Xenococcus sp. MO_188.B8]
MATKILIVDDNQEIINVYVKTLNRKLNIQQNKILVEIDSVDTIDSAIEKLNQQYFDILIVDLKIPGLSGEEWGGLDIINVSLDTNPLSIIIAVTGYANIDLARKTFSKGVFRFIEKSNTAKSELTEAVKEAIENRMTDIVRAGNPFTPMSSQEPTVFGGRTEELRFIEDKIFKAIERNYCEHFLILGKWGIGKSTLLKEYKKLCQSRGHIATIVNLEPFLSGTKLIDAARSLVEGVLRSLPFDPYQFRKMIGF